MGQQVHGQVRRLAPYPGGLITISRQRVPMSEQGEVENPAALISGLHVE
jgi:hypothetical protein